MLVETNPLVSGCLPFRDAMKKQLGRVFPIALLLCPLHFLCVSVEFLLFKHVPVTWCITFPKKQINFVIYNL